jgi:hypothetical protein
MRLARERLVLFGTFAVLLFCAVMAVRQFVENQSRHSELREAFVLAHTKGYTADELRLYYRLKYDLPEEPTRHLIDDLERTTVMAPTNQHPSTNLLVSYHLHVKREVEKRMSKQHFRAGRDPENVR